MSSKRRHCRRTGPLSALALHFTAKVRKTPGLTSLFLKQPNTQSPNDQTTNLPNNQTTNLPNNKKENRHFCQLSQSGFLGLIA